MFFDFFFRFFFAKGLTMKRRAREEREESKEEIEVEKRNWEKLDVQFVGEDFRRSLFISPVPEVREKERKGEKIESRK